MSCIYFLQYKSDVGRLDTWPRKRAEIIYPWCPPIHFSIPRSYFWQRSSNLFIGPSKLTSLDSSGRVGAFFSPDGEHILVICRCRNGLSCHAVVWNIEKGEELLQIESVDFVFIHCGHHKGRIASIDCWWRWIFASNSNPGQVVGYWEWWIWWAVRHHRCCFRPVLSEWEISCCRKAVWECRWVMEFGGSQDHSSILASPWQPFITLFFANQRLFNGCIQGGWRQMSSETGHTTDGVLKYCWRFV